MTPGRFGFRPRTSFWSLSRCRSDQRVPASGIFPDRERTTYTMPDHCIKIPKTAAAITTTNGMTTALTPLPAAAKRGGG